MTGNVQHYTAGLVVSRDAVTWAIKFRAREQPLEGWGPAPHLTRHSDCSWTLRTVSAKTDDAKVCCL
jgi:hypothetical protein